MNDETALDLRAYLGILVRRKVLIAGIVIVVVATAVTVSLFRPARYTSSAEMLLETQTSDPLASSRNSDTAARDLNNVVRELKSPIVRDKVDSVYKGTLSASNVHASVASADADVISLSATSADADEAANLVNTYAQTYIDYRKSQTIDALAQTGKQIQGQISAAQKQLDAVQAQAAALDRSVAAASTDTQRTFLQSQRAALDPQITSAQTQLLYLQQQAEKIELSANIQRVGDLRVVAPAEPATTPSSPRPKRDAALALIVGLMLGVGAAFLAEQLDNSIRDKDTLESITGLPTLGVIPHIPLPKDPVGVELVAVTAPTSPAAEAYRMLRTSVKFLGIEREAKVVQVTSPMPGEGKTLTVINLAVVFAQAGDKVLVIGCDLRRPRVDAALGIGPGPGLTTVVLGEATLAQAVVPHPSIPELSLLRSGEPPPNPSELLGSAKTERLLKSLLKKFDTIILDCPPVLPVTDALVLTRYADLTLLLASQKASTRRSVHRAVELLKQVEAPLVGTIFNEASGGGDAYYYGSKYGYGGTPAPVAENGPVRPRRMRRPSSPEEPAPMLGDPARS